jgi:hypothetical protein
VWKHFLTLLEVLESFPDTSNNIDDVYV